MPSASAVYPEQPVALSVHPADSGCQRFILCAHQQLFIDRGIYFGSQSVPMAAWRLDGPAGSICLSIVGYPIMGNLHSGGVGRWVTGQTRRLSQRADLFAGIPHLLHLGDSAAASMVIWCSISAGGHGGRKHPKCRFVGDAQKEGLSEDFADAAGTGSAGSLLSGAKLQAKEPICVYSGTDYLQLVCRNGVDLYLHYPGGQHFGPEIFRDDLWHL